MLSMTTVDIDFELHGSTGDPIDQMGVISVSGATLNKTNMGDLTSPGGFGFTLVEEVEKEYQQRVFALRYGNAP